MNTSLSCARRSRFASVFIASIAILALGKIGMAGPVLPNFSASNFSPGAPIDNPYFPLVPGTTFHGGGTTHDLDTGETATERDEHLTPEQCGELARLAMPRQLALTHLYPPVESVDVAAIVRARYDRPVVVAYDGWRTEIGD